MSMASNRPSTLSVRNSSTSGGPVIVNIDGEDASACRWLLVDNDLRPELSQVVRLNEWRRIQTIRRPSDNNEDVTLYRRRNTP